MQYVFEHVSAESFMDDPTSYMQQYVFNEYCLVVVFLSSIIGDAYFFIDETDKVVNMTYIDNTYRADDDVEKRFVQDWDNDGRDELIEYRTEYGLGEEENTKLCIYSFTGNEMKEIKPVADKNTGTKTGKIYKRPFRGKTLFVSEQNPNETCSINYCVFDDSAMIEFHQELKGCHKLRDVIVEDWDGNETEDIRVIYSEYIDYHDCINEVVFSLENNQLVPLFFITTDDKFYYQEGYPENVPYCYREYKKTKSGVLIHEYKAIINLDEKSPNYNKITHISNRTYEKSLVNNDLDITDIYRFEDDYEDITVIKSSDKYGFMDANGAEVVPLKYDYAHNFSEGLAAVKLNGKWGFIDKMGKEVIPLKYDNVSALFCDGFWEGLAPVELNGKWGFINKSGEEVISFRYDFTWGFSEGLAAVKLNGKWGYIDRCGKQIIPFRYDEAYNFLDDIAKVELNMKLFNIDKKGDNVD
jgi:hypothetical protein